MVNIPFFTKKMAALLIVSLPLLFADQRVYAQDNNGDEARRYRVEMIVFSYEIPDETVSEQWPENTQVVLPDSYYPLYSISDITPELLESNSTKAKKEQPQLDENLPADSKLPLTHQQRVDLANNRLPDLFFLPDEILTLTSERDRLGNRDSFRILFHQGWNMPIYDREHSIPIHIKGGDQYDNIYELDGSIRLSIARYLHLDTQLYFREFEPSQNNNQTRIPSYDQTLAPQGAAASTIISDSSVFREPNLALLGLREYQVKTAIPLKQSRRMRSGDLHYIDNPRFGILIQLTPQDPAEEPIRLSRQ